MAIFGAMPGRKMHNVWHFGPCQALWVRAGGLLDRLLIRSLAWSLNRSLARKGTERPIDRATDQATNCRVTGDTGEGPIACLGTQPKKQVFARDISQKMAFRGVKQEL